jgi:tripartite-type tricarboxylate transporter receptor subunit TctC
MRVRFGRRFALVVALFALSSATSAQQFPDRHITLVVPFPPGGATDAVGRVVGKRMGEILGQPVVIENRGGAGGTVGIDYVSRQPADGYTVVFVNALPHTASKSLYGNLKYDPITSFTPIGSVGTVSYVLVINPKFPARTLDEFIKAAREAPAKYNFASSGVASAPHLAMEVFVRSAGVNLVHVPYQGSGPAMTGVVAGDVQAAMDNVAAIPLVKGGKLRALAQTGKARSSFLPDVPTFAEAGLPQFDVTGIWGLIGPAGIPPKTVAILGDALARAVNDPAVRETLLAQGITPESGTAQQFAAVLSSEMVKWTRLIEQANIKP